MTNNPLEITILMPCLNEEETIGICITKALKSISDNNLHAEVLVADNGSRDNSISIAESLGARVILVAEKGYGNVLRAGIKSAYGQYIIMADSDDSYDFSNIMPFVVKLREDYDLVMGNRFAGGVEKGAMPFLHRYLGNPVLSFIGRLFFRIPIGDFHCGQRGFKRKSILAANLSTTGMEFASEMIIKSALNNQRITEIPVKLYPDGRSRPPHLRTWNDGWRHLRFLLLYSPSWLFLWPGVFLIMFGILITSILLPAPLAVGRVTFDVHTMLYSALSIPIGLQIVSFYYCSRLFALKEGFVKSNKWITWFNLYFSLERGLLTGTVLFLIGVILTARSIYIWKDHAYGALAPSEMMRSIIPSVIFLMVGTQVIFNSFFASFLNLRINHISPEASLLSDPSSENYRSHVA